MTEKTCPQCKETKPVDQFHKSKQTKDGLRGWCKPCTRASNNKWKANNKELHNQMQRDWYKDNKEHHKEKNRKYREANPDKMKAKFHRRRARVAHAVPQRWRKSECPDTNCYWCGVDLSTVETHVEHIMPIGLGGPAVQSNEAPACADCNLRKNSKHPLVWIAQQF